MPVLVLILRPREAPANKLPFLGIPVAAALVFHYGGKGIPLVYRSRAESEKAMEGRPAGKALLSRSGRAGRSKLLLFTKSLGVGLAVRIKELLAALLPCSL